MEHVKKTTEERCIAAIAEIHPYDPIEIKNVFERCGSIDKTIDIIYKARQTKRELMDVCELILLID